MVILGKLADKVKGVVHFVAGSFIVARGVTTTAVKVATRTGKEALTMTAPAPTKELDAAIDAAFGFALSIKQAMAPGSPGGKTITLDELLHTVTDGNVRTSVQNLLNAIESIVKGGHVDVVAVFKLGVVAVLDFVTNLSAAMKGGFNPEELLAGVTDGTVRTSLQEVIDGVGQLPAEIKGLDMWGIMGIFQRVSAWIPKIVGPVA